MIRTEIGKIKKIWLGLGGYQDAQFGVTFELGGKGWGCGDFDGAWARDPDSYCKWTDEDRSKEFNKMCLRIRDLLQEAGVTDINQLEGIPIEVTFENRTLKSWRILTEVL